VITLLLVALGLTSDVHGPYVQVTATDPGGVELASLSDAVARALVVTGATVVVGPSAQVRCGPQCARLTVVKHSAVRYRLEARQSGRLAMGELQLPGGASSLDIAQALAIEARLLMRWPTVPVLESARPRVATRDASTPAALVLNPSDEGAAPQPVPGTAVAMVGGLPPVPASLGPGPVSEGPRLPVPDPTADAPHIVEPHRVSDRLAFSTSATVMHGLGSGFAAIGLHIGARAAIVDGLEARLGISLLEPNRAEDAIGNLRTRARPITATLDAAVPGVNGLSAGVGAELLLVEVDRRDGPPDASAQSLGGRAQVELKRSLGHLSATLELYASMHPGGGTSGVLESFPRWSMGGSLGLLFPLL
jgi:hypothetical protein